MSRIASWLDITPSFPDFTGPYAVGTVDVEIPVSDLPASALEPQGSVPTIAFRIFYPSVKPSKPERPVRWLPNPQRAVLAAYMKFLGSGSAAAGLLSLISQHMYYITIPAHRNAPLLQPAGDNQRWPVMVFSHGLGGSRNAYSQLAGSIASHGIVVVAPDHRDGSAVLQHVRTEGQKNPAVIGYKIYPHEPSEEVYKGRDDMLRIRLWELGLLHDSLLQIDQGIPVQNLDPNSPSRKKSERKEVLSMFKGKLLVHEPGRISWAGHSFGSATMVQLVKSVYWRDFSDGKADRQTLFHPFESSSILRQITPSSPLLLLDMWCLPLESPWTSWLREQPMPCYAPSGPGGKAVVSILSEDFFKWQSNLNPMLRILAPPRTDDGRRARAARFFYPAKSAHLSQSDFGILFPRLTKLMFKTDDSGQALKLNTRAILQHLRENEFQVANTADVEIEADPEDTAVIETDRSGDWKILSGDGSIKGWMSVNLDLDETSLEEDTSEDELDAKSKGDGPAPMAAQVFSDAGTAR